MTLIFTNRSQSLCPHCWYILHLNHLHKTFHVSINLLLISFIIVIHFSNFCVFTYFKKFAAILNLMGGTRKTWLMFLFLYVVFFMSANTYTCAVVGLNSSSANAAADIKCIDRERHALLMIKKDLVDEYGHLSSWGDEEGDCCNWRAIKCNNQTGHITMLDLRVTIDFYHQPLKGKISPSLIELQHLTYLDLSCNDFGWNYNIPAFIGSLTNLRYLNLSNVVFKGSIPYQLGNLSSLQFLDLNSFFIYENPISSENLSWLSHLSSLRYLDMSRVKLEKAVDWMQAINMLPSIVDLRLGGCSLSSSVVPPHLSLFNSSSSLSVLDLSQNSFTFEICHWLFNFVGGRHVDLNLSYNQLEGPILDAFGNMTYLAHLDLSSNYIEGGIPKSLGNLLHLQTLDLSLNRIDGSLAEIVQNLSGHAMNTLEILDLSLNKISGYVPDITIFSSLKELRLYYSNLNGSLPSKFEHPSKLEVFDMRYNQITGSLSDLSVFSCLRKLDLSKNQINGSLPESIGQLSKLEYLDVSSNKLQGTISEAHFSTLTELKDLDLSDNSFLIFDISSEWLPPFQLDILVLRSCKLGPDFPVWLQTQKNVSKLDISNAEISGVIPNWFWDLHHNSVFLNLSYNNMKGILPDLSSKFSRVPAIHLRSNHLEGPIPLFPYNTTLLDLSKNRFKGPISIICSIIGGYLNYLDLSNNLLSGQLPYCWWQLQGLRVLNLANNQFDGKIPNSMGSLISIESLHLTNNKLTGELSSSLQNCTSLITMDVGENKLTGKLPAWIGEKLSRLIIFRLRSNNFYGSIPTQLCNLHRVQLFDISLNSITGTIPRCFNNFTAIAQNWPFSETTIGSFSFDRGGIDSHLVKGFDDHALVSWKGRIYEYGSTLGLVKSIDLSSNKLIGEIPLGITNLSGLLSLNLSRNNLVGLIPLDIGLLKILESLDLSRNRLFGEIPGSMSDLNSLSFLDLSNNNLTGKIPSSTQLQSFETSAFVGNPALCGPPLTKKCPGDYTNQGPPTSTINEDAVIQIDEDEFVLDRWFYASIALGFIVGFWGVCGTLVLHRSWRHAYFRFFDNSKDWLYVRIAVHAARMRRKIQTRFDRFL